MNEDRYSAAAAGSTSSVWHRLLKAAKDLIHHADTQTPSASSVPADYEFVGYECAWNTEDPSNAQGLDAPGIPPPAT